MSDNKVTELAAASVDVDAITAEVVEAYDSNDAEELACAIDDALREHGVTKRCAWLLNKAHAALNAW